MGIGVGEGWGVEKEGEEGLLGGGKSILQEDIKVLESILWQ